jgi:hypothetical protein
VVEWKRIYGAVRAYFDRSWPTYPTPTNHRLGATCPMVLLRTMRPVRPCLAVGSEGGTWTLPRQARTSSPLYRAAHMHWAIQLKVYYEVNRGVFRSISAYGERPGAPPSSDLRISQDLMP